MIGFAVMNYQYIDTHTHVNLQAYTEDWEEVISRTREAGVAMINIGTQQDTSRRAVEIAAQYEDGVYAAVGLHPVHTDASYHDEKEFGPEQKGFTTRGEVFDTDFYRALAASEKVVAIGECGLDYYRISPETKEKQNAAFIAQIELANEVEKPLMLHIRPSDDPSAPNAYEDAYEIIKNTQRSAGTFTFLQGLLKWQRNSGTWGTQPRSRA